MPELPDVEAYGAALRPRVVDATLQRVRVVGISLLKSFDPPVDALEGCRCTGVRRLGKRIVLEFEDDGLYAVLHLMIAGRLRWREHGATVPRRLGLAALDWSRPGEATLDGGTLVITEAGTRKRASLHVERGRDALAGHDRGGIEPLHADRAAFVAELTRENRTLKRALTDPRRFSGIGNAYSDEILHAAGLSPVQRTGNLDDAACTRLYEATQTVLGSWTQRLTAEAADAFPEKVTAFRPEFAVHGRYGEPCPVCGTTVQRIRYAENETNYCPGCQTGGRLLADRGLSRLLKDDWPSHVDQLEGA